MKKLLKISLIIAFFGVLFNGLVYMDIPKTLLASLIKEGNNTGVKVYYEDFLDPDTLDTAAGATSGLDETEIKFGRLIQKGQVKSFEIPFDTASDYTYDNEKIEVNGGSAVLMANPSLLQGLETYLRMDEGTWNGSNHEVVDATGNNHHMTSVGGANTFFGGKIGRAGVFDGNDDYLEDVDGINYINGLTAFTTYLWIKSDVTDTDKGFLIAKEPDGSDDIFALRYDAVGATSRCTNCIKAGITTTGGVQQIESSSGVQTTNWQHVALSWSSGNQLKLYIDGALNTPSSNDSSTNGSITGATTLFFGKGAKDTSSGWDGLLDEVRIYNRELSAEEIALIYAGGPTIYKTSGDADNNLIDFVDFAETTTVNHAGVLKYQLTEDGITWKYWTGSAWDTATLGDGNSVAEVSAYISDFPILAKKIYVRSFLVSDGSQAVELDNLSIRYNSLSKPETSTEILGPFSTGDEFYAIDASISNEASGIRYISFRLLDLSLNPITVGVDTIFDSSDLPLDIQSISEDDIYLEVTFHNDGVSSSSVELNYFSVSYTEPPEDFLINMSNAAVGGTSNIEYTIRVQSKGGDDWEELVITNVLDPDLQYLSTTDEGVVAAGQNVLLTYTKAEFTSQNVSKSFLVNILPSGESRNKICNFATGTTDGLSIFISSQACTTINGGGSAVDGNFSVSKTANLDSNARTIEYDLTLTNTGGTNWETFSLIDVLDENLQYVSTSDSGISTNGQVVSVNYTVAELAGGSATKTFITQIQESAIDQSMICNITYGSADGNDMVFSNKSCDDISSLSICGNNFLNSGEQCDDGNTTSGDGCSSSCFIENAVCGNGEVETGEQCDDGNTTAGDGCNSICFTEAEVCGNGTVGPGEQCDDGNTIGGDGCSATCQSEQCGNNVLDAGEECDDGNNTSGDGCSIGCQNEICGNNVLDAGEQCDDGNTSDDDGCDASCQVENPVCGNDTVEFGEQCDDGNTTSGDGCNSSCQTEGCGNNVIDAGEQCDDGNDTGGDGCSASCQDEICGNDILDFGEQCDDGNTTAGDGCNISCQNEVCGNNVQDTGEQCDDGNTTSGDGCTASCVLEIWACGDGNKEGLEQCDDGNSVSGDGCSASCQSVESGWTCSENQSGLSLCTEMGNDFAISKTATPVIGTDKITYYITVEKLGGNKWEEFTVTDVLNSDLTYVGTSNTGVSYSSQVVTLKYQLSDFSASTSITKSFNVQIRENGANRNEICNFAFGSYNESSVYISNNSCAIITGGDSGVNASFEISGTTETNTTEETIEYHFTVENISGDDWSSFVMTDVLPDDLEYVRSSQSGISVNGQIVSLIFNKSEFGSSSSLEKSFITRAKEEISPGTLVCNFAWGSADQGEVITYANQLCNSTPDASAELHAEIVREMNRKDSMGKAASRMPGQELGAEPLTIEETNKPIAPRIIYDEKGNVLQIIPGKLDPLKLAERLMNKPKPVINRGNASSQTKESAQETSIDPLANVKKSPGRTISKEYSSAKASANLRKKKQQKWKDDYQKWIDTITPDLEVVEEVVEPEEAFEVLEEVTIETLLNAPVVAQKTEIIDRTQGGEMALNVSGEGMQSQEIGLDIPAGLLTDVSEVSVEMKALDMGELPVTAATENGEMLMFGAVLDLSITVEDQKVKQFDKTMNMSISYDPTEIENIEPTSLSLHYLNEESGNWEPLPDTVIDLQNNTINAQTDHSSFFTVLANLFSGVSESEYIQYKSSAAPEASSYKDLVAKTKKLTAEKELEEAKEKYSAGKVKEKGLSYKGLSQKYKYVDPKKALEQVQGQEKRIFRRNYLRRVTYPTQVKKRKDDQLFDENQESQVEN